MRVGFWALAILRSFAGQNLTLHLDRFLGARSHEVCQRRLQIGLEIREFTQNLGIENCTDNVRFMAKSGQNWQLRPTSAYDPKRTFGRVFLYGVVVPL